MTMTTADILAAYGLPELPEPEDPELNNDLEGNQIEPTVWLILFRFQQENITLAGDILKYDAQAYCQRDDTSGDGWFVGYRA